MFIFLINTVRRNRSSHLRLRTLLGQEVVTKLEALHKEALNTGLVSNTDLAQACCKSRTKASVNDSASQFSVWYMWAMVAFIMVATPFFFQILTFIFGTHCFVPNNSLVWEATRPISDCKFCIDISNPLIMRNMSPRALAQFAYSSRPIIIKRAVSHWPALHKLSFAYLKDLYESIPGALNHDCPLLLHSSADLHNLHDIFHMSKERLMGQDLPWYVGWSTCHPAILQHIRSLYPRPHFLPLDAEMANTDYIFLGYEQGPRMHLDYIPRLMWQAQLQGNKTWILAPTLECDAVCKPFSFYVEAGDALLLDTRNWYHGSFIPKGQFALTIQSEYG